MFEYHIPAPSSVPEVANWSDYDGYVNKETFIVKSKSSIPELEKYLIGEVEAVANDPDEDEEEFDTYTKKELREFGVEELREMAVDDAVRFGFDAEDIEGRTKKELIDMMYEAQFEDE